MKSRKQVLKKAVSFHAVSQRVYIRRRVCDRHAAQLAQSAGVRRSCRHRGNDPRPVAINAATFVGTRLAGIPGALTATLGGRGHDRLGRRLILTNAVWAGEAVTLADTNWAMAAIFAVCLVLLRKTKLSPILVMLLAGAVNLLLPA